MILVYLWYAPVCNSVRHWCKQARAQPIDSRSPESSTDQLASSNQHASAPHCCWLTFRKGHYMLHLWTTLNCPPGFFWVAFHWIAMQWCPPRYITPMRSAGCATILLDCSLKFDGHWATFNGLLTLITDKLCSWFHRSVPMACGPLWWCIKHCELHCFTSVAWMLEMQWDKFGACRHHHDGGASRQHGWRWQEEYNNLHNQPELVLYYI